jgi:dTDP-4-dehydrorhamnose reductase
VKTILISGGSGNLASHLLNYGEETEYFVVSLRRKEMDVTDRQSISEALDTYKPDIFIHSAAYTRPMSKHQDNPEISLQTNIIGTSNVTLECMTRDIKLVYISTDYVYPGVDGNYSEDSGLSPFVGNNDGVTKYGWSKLGGECAVKLYDGSLILRLCICNYPFPHAKAATDVKKSLMYDRDAAKVIFQLLDEQGVINVGGPAQSVYNFAKVEFTKVGKISRKNITEVLIAPDTSMNTNKMNSILLERGRDD